MIREIGEEYGFEVEKKVSSPCDQSEIGHGQIAISTIAVFLRNIMF